jgi:hypothetical protein
LLRIWSIERRVESAIAEKAILALSGIFPSSVPRNDAADTVAIQNM